MKSSLPVPIDGLTFIKSTEDIMKKVSTLLAVAAVTSMMAAFLAPASAEGLIGGFIDNLCGGCGVGQALDDANKQLGNPVDEIGAAAAQYYGAPVSPNCATPWGVFVGPWLPIGVPCNVNGMEGVIVP
jgi:hypothetical protein